MNESSNALPEKEEPESSASSGNPSLEPMPKYSKAKVVRARNDEDHWERKGNKGKWWVIWEVLCLPFTFFSKS